MNIYMHHCFITFALNLNPITTDFFNQSFIQLYNKSAIGRVASFVLEATYVDTFWVTNQIKNCTKLLKFFAP